MPFSGNALPEHPIPVRHVDCGGVSEFYCVEWPPKVVVCPNCHTILRLAAQSAESQHLSYRKLS